MSINAYRPHVLVLPEDDANRQMANGFTLDLHCNLSAIQVLNEAGGWGKVLELFLSDYLSGMRLYPERRMILLMDFDNKPEDRWQFVGRSIPVEIKNRVFVLGVYSEPEHLRKASKTNFEEIGAVLAKECVDNKQDFWLHELLVHNEPELARLLNDVRPFLFA